MCREVFTNVIVLWEERLKGGVSTVVQVVVVVVITMMIMIKVFGCSIEESGFVRACCLYYSTVSAGLL